MQLAEKASKPWQWGRLVFNPTLFLWEAVPFQSNSPARELSMKTKMLALPFPYAGLLYFSQQGKNKTKLTCIFTLRLHLFTFLTLDKMHSLDHW